MCLAQRPQRNDAGEAQTCGLSVSSQAIYHWATALPCPSLSWICGLCTGLLAEKINKIQMIQHRAIRYTFNDHNFTSNVSNMLSKLNLPALEKCRQISSLTMFYKIKHQVNIPFPGNIQPSMRSRYTFPRSRINIHIYSFFPRTANLWNNLQPDLCNSPDHGTFRAGLLKTL